VSSVTDRTLPHAALSARAHDRQGLRRTDEAWLAERWADPTTRVLPLAGTRLRLRDGEPEWVSPVDAPPGRRLLLGEADGITRFAVVADPADVPGERDEWIGLRGAFGVLLSERGPDEAPWLFHAVGLAEWLWATRHCPRCGGALEMRHAGHEQACTQCGRRQFPRTAPAVIMAVVHGEGADERILLGHQRAWPEGRFSTLAGFVEPGETFEDAVRREVAEEVGVSVGRVDYVGNQPWPLPASLMIGFVCHALDTAIDVDGDEIDDARWFTRDELRGATESGEVRIPQGISISSSLIEGWHGGPLPGGW
jgi:NAD+ diphosphatase